MRAIPVWTICLAILLLLGDPAGAQSVASPSVLDESTASTETGAKTGDILAGTASDVLKGTGSGAGYVLAHGNVTPGSEWITVGSRTMRRNQDYTIDYAAGTLFFTKPVSQFESVRVDYRYTGAAAGERNVSAISAMPLSLAGTSSGLNFSYVYRAADPSKPDGAVDTMTYGLSSQRKIGDALEISSLMFLSNPETSNRMSLSVSGDGPKTTDKAKPKEAGEPKKDQFVSHKANLSMGSAKVSFGLQDVGENFLGFAAIRDANAVSESVLAGAQTEAGIKRTSMGFELPSGAAGGLKFSTEKIADAKGQISSQSIGFDNGRLGFNYSTLDVGSTFSKFGQLSDSDKALKAQQAGVKRTNFGMQFATGAKLDDGRMTGLSMSSERIQNDKDNIERLAYGYTAKDVTISWNRLNIGKSYADFAKLPDADKAVLAGEAGMRRTGLTMAFGERLSINTEKIENDLDSIEKSAYSYKDKGLAFNYSSLDIGKDFGAFAGLREADKAVLAAEAGMRRTNYDLSLGSGLSISNQKVENDLDSIQTRTVGYKAKTFAFNVYKRDVGKDFGAFAGLREADKGQIAAESGFTRTRYDLGFATGLNADKSPMMSMLESTSLSGESGGYESRSARINLSGLSFSADVQSMDQGFDKIAALDSADRGRIALAARRQFDPNAQADSITKKDLEATNNELGLNRKSMALQATNAGFSTWLSMSSIDSDKGGLDRKSVSLQSKAYSLSYYRHAIDSTFDRLAGLQPVEAARFGKESGMERTELAAALKLAGGDFSYQDKKVADEAAGSEFARSSMEFKSDRVKARVNVVDMPTAFARVGDLAESDVATLLPDAGFKSTDYAVNLQATKQLNIDSYVRKAANAETGRTKDRETRTITYAIDKASTLTAFTDNYCDFSEETGNISCFSRSKYSLDTAIPAMGGMVFKGFADTMVSKDGEDEPVNTNIRTLTVGTDPSARTSISVSTFNADYGPEKYQETYSVAVKTQATDKLAVTTSYSQTDTQEDKTLEQSAVAVDWAVHPDLKLVFNVGNNLNAPTGSTKKTNMLLTGVVAKNLGIVENLQVTSAIDQADLNDKQTANNNTLNLQATVLGVTTEISNSDVLDPKKGVYNTARSVKLETPKTPDHPYSFSYARHESLTPAGLPVARISRAVSWDITEGTTVNFSSFFGKDGEKGEFLPIGGTKSELCKALNARTKVTVDYSADSDEGAVRRARKAGVGLTGDLSKTSQYRLYYGWTRLVEGDATEHRNIYQLSYERALDSSRTLSISAQKLSNLDRKAIDPEKGSTFLRADYKTAF